MKIGSKFLLCLAVIVGFVSCGKKEEAKSDASKEDVPVVKIERVVEEIVPQTTNYTATVEAYKTNNITTSTANRIKKIMVEVGSHVGKGQTVVILDDVNIDQMRLRLANKKVEMDRAIELLKIGGGTQQSVDQLRTEYEAYHRSFENMKENTTLVSPISGVVTARNYDNGDMTSAQPILTIQQIEPVKVIVNVSEQDFTKVKMGLPVKITLDVYGDEQFDGKVSLIHPTIDPATRTFQVEININNKNGKVRPGMFARVSANYGSKQRVVVPDQAVVKQSGSGNKYVYVYHSNGTVSYNQVEVGQRVGNRYELISGVVNNSDVVISGQMRLANGVKVKVTNK